MPTLLLPPDKPAAVPLRAARPTAAGSAGEEKEPERDLLRPPEGEPAAAKREAEAADVLVSALAGRMPQKPAGFLTIECVPVFI